ncbi:MAG: fibronectin-binding autotransporter adhesin [Chthoniobacter sp.]|jgi:autotransporter-associated beta strand protein|nr:fibronectin-binding autotransporter adhesin [Chthoniobacter sp.]
MAAAPPSAFHARVSPTPFVAALAVATLIVQAGAIVYRDDLTDAEVKALASQPQFSGTGIISGSSGTGTGVAIASDWVLTAKHVVTGGSSATFFYAGGNQAGTVFLDASTDLALIHLSSALPSTLSFITPNQNRSDDNRLVWPVGYGTWGNVSSQPYNSLDGARRAGTNVSDLNSTGFLRFDNDNTSASATAFEASTGPGDSGGPLFLQDGNQWFVAGITFGADTSGFINTDVSARYAWITQTTGLTFTPKAASLALKWDNSYSSSGIQDGAGVWDTTGPNFQDGTYNYSWDNSLTQSVTFGNTGTAGTVTLGAAISVNKIIFARTGYTITGTASAVLSLNGTTPTIDTGAAGLASTISAKLGASTITLAGAGTLTLSGADDNANTRFDLGSGKLVLAKSSSTSVHAAGGSGSALTIATGATAQLAGTGGDQVSDSSDVTINGGTFDLNGRGESINALLGTTGTVDNTAAGSASLTIGASNGGGTFAGTLKDTGGAISLTKLGTGTAILSGTNSYAGATAVQAGTLQLLSAGALGNSSGVTLTNTTVSGGAGTTLVLQGGLTYSGVPLIMNSDTVNDRRTSLVSNGSTNTWSAPITLNGSGLSVFNANTTGLIIAGNVDAGSFTGALLLRGGSASFLNGTVNLGSTGNLTKTDGGTWTIASSGNTWANTQVAVGTLKLGADQALPMTTLLTMGQASSGDATFDLSGFNQQVAGVALVASAGARTITNTGALKTFTVSNDTANSFGGTISGALHLTKAGAGVLTLTGSNPYTGATTVTASSVVVSGSLSATASLRLAGGTLELGAADRLNNAAPLTLALGTLKTGGFSETVGALTLEIGTSTIDFGTGASVVHFGVSSGNGWSGKLSITNWSGNAQGGGTDQLFFGVNTTGLLAAQLAAIEWKNPFGLGDVVGARFVGALGEVAPIPEPGTCGLLLGGLSTLLGLRRSRCFGRAA